MRMFIHVKQFGKRRNTIDQKIIIPYPVPETVAGLIASVVIHQVDEYNSATVTG